MGTSMLVLPWVAACSAIWMPSLRLSLSAPTRTELDAMRQTVTAPLAQYPGSTCNGRRSLPRGLWFVNECSAKIGHGREGFTEATQALACLQCFELSWLTALLHGDELVVCSRQLGMLWMLNANRVLRRQVSSHSHSVTWGTTRQHVLAGEERLRVYWDKETDAVFFEILSFSRPRHLLAWLGYPYVIAQQMRFAHDATAVMTNVATRSSQHTEVG